MIQRLVRSATLGVALAFVVGCESAPPEPIHRESMHEVRATVVEVQKAKRLVGLKGADGKVVTVTVGPEARNFDQLAVGDTVVATYYESVSFALKAPGEVVQPGMAAVVGERTPAGERPGGAVSTMAETTVTFQSYDPATFIVTYTDEHGAAHAATVQRPDGREFASKLKQGDRVVISAQESVAVKVEAGK
jgi:hypothetical protein